MSGPPSGRVDNAAIKMERVAFNAIEGDAKGVGAPQSQA